jgi:lipoprotein-releasing system permease protein
MLSSFSIISLIGVMLGVLTLVVVMAVYAGLERSVKNRILGFTPHVLLKKHDPTASDSRMVEWKEEVAKVKAFPNVEAATPYVSDNVIVDVASWQKPVLFNGIDTSDPAQVQGLKNMLDLAKHPSSTADLGIDDRVVISSILAQQLAIGVGDKIRLYSTRNFQEVMDAYKATEKPPVREAFAEVWKKSTEALSSAWQNDGDAFTLTFPVYRECYNALLSIHEERIREPERVLLQGILSSMDGSEKDDTKEVFRFDAAAKAEIEKAINELNTTDAEKMDAETLKGLKSVVLPKEAFVVGVYQASQMALTPDLFVPLPLAQDLAGLDDAVQGIAIRLNDAYQADNFAKATMPKLDAESYQLTTWGEQYEAFFSLIEQQRSMMYFMLSFIILIAAFSMMAVMFTVTIQKRREIGVMKALGAAPNQIIRVFLYQGMILGTLGAILGVVLGRLVIHFRGNIQAMLRTVGFDPFSSSLTGFDILPAYNDPVEQAKFAVMAFVLCSLAAMVPAFFAARSDAAKSLRNL